jgi:hypothetical protein
MNPNPNPVVSCSSCAFFVPGPLSRGTCRRKAPLPGPGDLAHWPQVATDDGCGEGVAVPAQVDEPAPAPPAKASTDTIETKPAPRRKVKP